MHSRSDLVRLAAVVLVGATAFTAVPKSHAEENPRASLSEPSEGKAPKKTKRKRAAHGHARKQDQRTRHSWPVRGWVDLDRRPSRHTRVERVLAAARGQLGKPYRWAGTGPSAFDCSGLTRFAWGRGGVDLPHSSRGQFAAVKRVDLNELKPGDLVFSGPGNIGHVGIYIGGGRMIHAPQSGRRIEVAPLRSNLIGAGRPS